MRLLVAGVVFGFVAPSLVMAAPGSKIQQVSYCDLAAHPDRYVGHVVSVWASYAPTLNETAALFNDRCRDWRSIALSRTTGDPLHNLTAYRAPEDIKAAPFRIWGRFIGTMVRERPIADPYLDDDGLHFRPADVTDVKAINVRSEVSAFRLQLDRDSASA